MSWPWKHASGASAETRTARGVHNRGGQSSMSGGPRPAAAAAAASELPRTMIPPLLHCLHRWPPGARAPRGPGRRPMRIRRRGHAHASFHGKLGWIALPPRPPPLTGFLAHADPMTCASLPCGGHRKVGSTCHPPALLVRKVVGCAGWNAARAPTAPIECARHLINSLPPHHCSPSPSLCITTPRYIHSKEVQQKERKPSNRGDGGTNRSILLFSCVHPPL